MSVSEIWQLRLHLSLAEKTMFRRWRNIISDAGLVTLTGVGGVGKTRLSIEIAGRVRDQFPDGLWFCELAPVGDPEMVGNAVASALEVPLQQGMTAVESVVDALKDRQMLVVLDNCEHVLGAAGKLLQAVTAGTASVSVLATSREPLGLQGEHVWSVRSLDAGSEATELFVDRAHSTDMTFEASDSQLETISVICRRLDGVPLAIELAAARTRSMSVADIDGRLDDRFRLLRGARWAGAASDASGRGAMVGKVYMVSIFEGRFEVREWLPRPPAAVALTIDLHGLIAWLCTLQGDHEEGEQIAREGIAAAEAPLAEGTGPLWNSIVNALFVSGDLAGAAEVAESALIAADRESRPYRKSVVYGVTAIVLPSRDRAVSNAQEAQRIAVSLRNVPLLSGALTCAALRAELDGSPEEAERIAKQSIEVARASGATVMEDSALMTLAQSYAARRHPEAGLAFHEAIRVVSDRGDFGNLLRSNEQCAHWLRACGRDEEAATILSFILESHNFFDSDSPAQLEDLRADAALKDVLLRGAAMTREEVIAYSLSVTATQRSQ